MQELLMGMIHMLHSKIVHHFQHVRQINDAFIDQANHIYIAISMYNLIEYSDNYSDTSGRLWQCKRDEPLANYADLVVNNNNFNFQWFKWKAALIGKTLDYVNPKSLVKNTKIFAPLKYLSDFWRSLVMPLINCKPHLELDWIEECILLSAGDSAKFKITDAELHVPIATLSTKDNVNLTKQLSGGFKRSAYWNNYQTIPANILII